MSTYLSPLIWLCAASIEHNLTQFKKRLTTLKVQGTRKKMEKEMEKTNSGVCLRTTFELVRQAYYGRSITTWSSKTKSWPERNSGQLQKKKENKNTFCLMN